MAKKCVLLILDGVGDRSYDELMHRTPLQAAKTPALDTIAEMGWNGLYHASKPGKALASENAHFAMFGYGTDAFPGRGALEALGFGIDLNHEEVAILGHIAVVREEGKCLLLEKDKPDFSTEEAHELTGVVGEFEEDGIEIRFVRTKGLYGIIVMNGDVSPFVTDSAPMREGAFLSEIKPWLNHSSDRFSLNTAVALKKYLVWAYRCLGDHPINRARRERSLPELNGIMTQRAGRLKNVTSFGERYGLRGLSIASGLVYHGLSSYIGMDYRPVSDTNDPARDIADRLVMARESLEQYDFIHIHTKVADETAHSKDPMAKQRVIEELDKGIGWEVGPIMQDSEVLLIVTADHSTPSAGPLIHSGEPVPLTICGANVRRDEVRRFDEISASQGALGAVRGRELMYLILNALDRAKLSGIMDTPVDQPFWPGDYEPFRLD
jgi:2,3-bisphosphoglycerate-independent phosphoglycerate mutase